MINCCKIRVKSDAVFIVNLLNYNKIPLKRVQQGKKYTEFTVKAGQLAQMEKLFSDHNKEYEILQNTSIKDNFKKNIIRFGLYAGLLFVILFMYFYANTLTRVEISGNKEISDETIYSVITEFVELPSFNDDLDCDKLTKNLIAIDGISSASVERKGNTLIVNVYEALPEVTIEDKTNFTDIVSKYDSIITRIVTYSGTAAVKKGDSVRKGDTIFSSVIDLGDGLTTQEYVNGIAYGRVWFTKEIVIEPTYIVAERTGNSVSHICFYNKTENYTPPYAQYEVETSSYYLSNIVSLKYTKYTYYETENVTKEVDFYDNEEAIVEEYTNSLREQLPEECTILRNWYSAKILDKNIKLVIYYEVETKIT